MPWIADFRFKETISFQRIDKLGTSHRLDAQALTTPPFTRQLNQAMQKTLQLQTAAEEQTRSRAATDVSAENCVLEKKVHKERGLLYIGLFKISKSVGCLLIGAMCLHLIHTDLGTVAMKLIEWLGMNPGSRFASTFLDRADLVSGHDLRITGALSFAGCVVYAVEGTGLMLRKVWAEYFTVILTTLALPWEIYEMFRHFTVWKVGLFLANVLVLIYLVWLLRRKRARELRST